MELALFLPDQELVGADVVIFLPGAGVAGIGAGFERMIEFPVLSGDEDGLVGAAKGGSPPVGFWL